MRWERKRDAVLGAACALAGALLMLNSLLEFLWPVP